MVPFSNLVFLTSPDKSEPHPSLQVVVATLSRGPVGPGDKMDGTNRTLLMRSGSGLFVCVTDNNKI